MKYSSIKVLVIATFVLYFILQINLSLTSKVNSQDSTSELQKIIEDFQNNYETRYMSAASMSPTLEVDDKILIDKHTYRSESPQRGDIIIFNGTDDLKKAGSNDPFIKRVIGLPGETIEIKSGQVYINNLPLQENYIAEPINYTHPSTKIPTNSYFVLGDNRNVSYDSHFWGFLPQSLIYGKAMGIYCPVEHQKVLTPLQLPSSKNKAILSALQNLIQAYPILCKADLTERN